jgi:hypothetical protein
MASVHGTYRQVVETLPALELVADCLARWNPVNCRWYLDAPVSNTRRLARLIDRAGAERGLTWQTELVNSPDRELAGETAIIATADSVILDQCGHWFNLTRQVIADKQIAVSPIGLT